MRVGEDVSNAAMATMHEDYIAESLSTARMMEAHPEWILPRSERRVFLGEPGAPEATKTTVEPGNSFSPGMRTFGVTWWLRLPLEDTFFAPETAPLGVLVWHYEEGYLPLIHCDVQVGPLSVRHTLFQDGTASERSEAVTGHIRILNTGTTPAVIEMFLVLRSLGPAGGPVQDLMIGPDERSFWGLRRHVALLGVDVPPSAIGCGVGDPSAHARRGESPLAREARDPDGWCYGLMRFDLRLEPGEEWQVCLDCPQQTFGMGGELAETVRGTATLRPEQHEARAAAHRTHWQNEFARIELDVPDEDFGNAFFAGIGHMLTAMVGDQARIAPLYYPLVWLRDSVFIIRSLDLAGHHERARAAAEYCARNDFFGGFGAEGDAPGQGIWTLVQHYRLTRDRDWLEKIYPDIKRKCDWLMRMRRAEAPIQIFVDTPVLAFQNANRAAGVVSVAARDGLIQGSMDGGLTYSLGWVNHWALCGLSEAAYAARELGHPDEAGKLLAEADELKVALEGLRVNRQAEYFSWDRTVNSLLWPTRAWEETPERVRPGFDAWWDANRGSTEAYNPEPYWLYFEFAQAHNALLFGERERAWQVIEYRLRHQDLPGLYGWREGKDGVGTANAVYGVTLIPQLRGCHTVESITPHGWSAAEMWLLQRAVLVEEWQGGVLLFAGVPRHWLKEGGHLSLKDFPTWYGRLSAELWMDANGHTAAVTVSGLRPETSVCVRLPGAEVTFVSGDLPNTIRVELA